MNTKTLGMAAILAALCLMPTASANDAYDADVTVTVSGALCTTPFDLEDTLGPAFHTRANVQSEDCVQTATYDSNSVNAVCGPAGSTPPYLQPRVTLDGDCGIVVEL